MKVDSAFLRDKNLLDYSVLLGIEIIKDAEVNEPGLKKPDTLRRLETLKETDRLS